MSDRPENLLIGFAENVFGKFVGNFYRAGINGSAKFGRPPVYQATKELLLRDLLHARLLFFIRLGDEAEISKQFCELLSGIFCQFFAFEGEPRAAVRVRERRGATRIRVNETAIRIRRVVRTTNDTAPGTFYLFRLRFRVTYYVKLLVTYLWVMTPTA